MADDVETVHLKTVADWNEFARRVNVGHKPTLNAVMDNDIDLKDCQTMIGPDNAYQGTFDGNGHTLTVHYNVEGSAECAPFAYVNGATIRNLIVKGEIVGKLDNGYGGVGIGGIVALSEAESEKINYISNCAVYAKLQSNNKSDESYIGGFVGYEQSPFIIDNCLFAGEIVDNSKNDFGISSKLFGGNNSGKSSVSNTLLLGKLNILYIIDVTDWKSLTATNVYEYEETVANQLPENIATQVTADQLTSGELAVLLNKNNNNPVWGQALGSDASPIPNGARSEITEATTYHITNGTNWRTLIYPKDTEAGEDLRIFTVSGVNNDKVLVFNELESGNIPANTPVILYKNPEATDATTGFTLKPYDYRNEAPATGYLRGVYTTTTAPVGSYVLQKHAGQAEPAFYKVADKQPAVKPYNCYLEVEQGSNAKSFSFPFFDTTGIQGVQADNVLNFGDGKIYTLDGKQVSHMEKGVIYILNGKKFIIK